MLEVPGAAGGEGTAFCLAACTDGVPSRVSEERLGRNSLAGEGGNRRGGLCSKVFWGGSVSSKGNMSGVGKRGIYRPYVQILGFEKNDREILKTLTAYQSVAAASGKRSLKPMGPDSEAITIRSSVAVV